MANKKILVVDDELDFLKMIKMRLEASDYEVITAANGKEALDLIKFRKPDAVLLDILMPGMDGLHVLKVIRSHDKALPVFMVTAFSNLERFEAANKLGASGFIVKSNDLKKEIENITSAITLSDKYKGHKNA